MSKGENMISVDEAVQIVLKKAKRLPPKKVRLESAQGLCLAEDIKSDSDMPPFNRSAMDGYAVIAKDTVNPPVDLVVIEYIRTGYKPKKKIEEGKAAHGGTIQVLVVQVTEATFLRDVDEHQQTCMKDT